MTPALNSTIRRWTANDVRKLAEHFEAGLTVGEIAARLGRTEVAITNRIHLLRRSGDERFAARAVPWSSDEDQQLLSGALAGEAFLVLAERLGRSVGACDTRLRTLSARDPALLTGAGPWSRSAPWTEVDDALLIHLHRKGATARTISRELDRTEAAVAARIETLRKTSSALRPRKPRWTLAERERLAERYVDGATFKQLSYEFGRSKGSLTVQLARLRREGIPLPYRTG